MPVSGEQTNVIEIIKRVENEPVTALNAIIHSGVQRLLRASTGQEVIFCLKKHQYLKDLQGLHLIGSNGRLHER